MTREEAILSLLRAVGHEPFAKQREILFCRKPNVLLVAGERFGKSYVAADYLTARLPEDKGKEMKRAKPEPLLYWLVGSDYAKVTKEWEYLIDNFSQLNWFGDKKPSKRVDPGEMVLADGTVIKTKSGTDPRGIAMESPNGILICEAAQVDLETFNRCYIRARYKEGWLFASGTMEGSLGWYPSLAKEWAEYQENAQSFHAASWENTVLFPGGRQDPKILDIERRLSEAMFNERCAGIPMPPAGLVYPEFKPWLHVRADVVYQPGYPVYIWNDPGYGTQSANAMEFAQVINGQIRIFDEIYEAGLVTEDLIHLAMSRPWWKEEGKFLVVDPNFKDNHNATSSVAEIWQAKTGLAATWSYPKPRVMPGIERVKTFLRPDVLTGQPGLVMAPGCRGLISELGGGPCPLKGEREGQTLVYKWKTGSGGEIIGEVPDARNNHACDAVRYGVVEGFGYVESGLRQEVLVTRFASGVGRRDLQRARG